MSAYADELSDEAKAWLAVKFAQLHEYFPPVRVEHLGGFTFTRTTKRPWQL